MSIVSTITSTVGRGLLQGRKFSPEILTGVGIAGVVVSGVLASRATLKLSSRVDNLTDSVEIVKDLHASGRISDGELKKELFTAYRKNTWGIVKLYGPSVTLGAASIAAILGGQGIMKQRNVALVAAYKAVEGSYAKYRERVVDKFGEDVDKELRFDLRAVNEKGEDGKNTGNKVMQSKEANGEKADPGLYAVYFDESNPNWSPRGELNKYFLSLKQNYWNDKLNARGHVFLNEVYEDLGFPHTGAGAVVGWIREGKTGAGDGFIDFSIFNRADATTRGFINGGNEPVILLDFNVDGTIWDKI